MNTFKKPELLAPAGNMESFFAAIDGGANAVYLGLKAFSARGRAANFTLRDLERLIPYAHGMGRKVYIAMNTIVREAEIPLVADNLAALSALGADALIIQDLGIHRIASRYFPEIPLHASTQMTIHNSAGVRQLKAMGFKRVVLAREMTLAEIGQVRKGTDMEIETFVHGSMCFSYAGACFFSSYLGGKSSNRGVCSQPCRREYRTGGKEFNPFSMGDLSTIDLVPDMMAAGIDSLKIEGRMKSVEFVDNAVRAYRMVMDAAGSDQADAIVKAKELLKGVVGRRRTTGFYLSPRPDAITVPERSGNLGRFAGKVVKCTGTGVVFKAAVDLHLRDRLRIQSVKTGGRNVFSLKDIRIRGREVKEAKQGESVEIAAQGRFNPGDSVFLTTSHEHRGKNTEAKRRFDALKGVPPGKKHLFRAEEIKALLRQEPMPSPEGGFMQGLLVRAGGLKDIAGVAGQCDGVIVPLQKATIHNLMKFLKKLKSMKEKIVWSLPLVIQEGDLPLYRDTIAFLTREGFVSWQVSNLSHFDLLKGQGLKLMTSQYLHALNSAAVKALSELGCRRITLSIESDMDNLSALAAAGSGRFCELLIYSHLPLYVSRVGLDARKRGQMGGQDGGAYLPKERDGLTYVYSAAPFSFFSYLKQFRKMGFTRFQIDLSGEEAIQADGREALRLFREGRTSENWSSMNLRTGLE